MPSKTVTKIVFPPKAVPQAATTAELRVAAYARVSSIKDAQENSLESQKDYFERYIKGHPGWQFAGIYVDDGISGLSYHRREGFNRMVQDALDGKIDRIITKSLSRFARNTVDALTTIQKLKAVGVAVYFQKENIDTLDTKGEFLLTLMSSFAEEESRSISENVTWAVRHRFSQGIYWMPYKVFWDTEEATMGRSPLTKRKHVRCGTSTGWRFRVSSRSTLPVFWTDRGSLLHAEQHHGLVQLCTAFCETRSTKGTPGFRRK